MRSLKSSSMFFGLPICGSRSHSTNVSGETRSATDVWSSAVRIIRSMPASTAPSLDRLLVGGQHCGHATTSPGSMTAQVHATELLLLSVLLQLVVMIGAARAINH